MNKLEIVKFLKRLGERYRTYRQNPFHGANKTISFGIGGLLVLIFASPSFFVADKKQTDITTQLFVSITPTAFPSSASPSSASPFSTQSSLLQRTVTTLPIITPTATVVPTSEKRTEETITAPTSTPSPEKPEFDITYPQEGQTITFNDPGQVLCVVTVPKKNTSGAYLYMNVNNQGWKNYDCYLPPTGSNTVSIKVKNGAGIESDVQTRNFIFEKTY